MTEATSIPKGLLQRLYHEGLAENEIAEQLECSPATVQRLLAAHGIEAGTPETSPWASGPQDPITWDAALAYAVGLLATRGNLARQEGDKVIFESVEYHLQAIFQRCLRVSVPIRAYPAVNGKETFFTSTVTDVRLYRFLQEIGFRPGSGGTSRAIAIPDGLFRDFARGCIDSNGSVLSTRRDRHMTMRVILFSFDARFISWVYAAISRLAGLQGNLNHNQQGTWWLEYTDGQALALLDWMYYTSPLPCLDRNRASYEQVRASKERENTCQPA